MNEASNNNYNMSHTIKEAKAEQEAQSVLAMRTRDIEALHYLAAQYKKQGDDEYAEVLRATAKRFEKEEWAYDESIGN
jgi:hypothetical protein